MTSISSTLLGFDDQSGTEFEWPANEIACACVRLVWIFTFFVTQFESSAVLKSYKMCGFMDSWMLDYFLSRVKSEACETKII